MNIGEGETYSLSDFAESLVTSIDERSEMQRSILTAKFASEFKSYILSNSTRFIEKFASQ